MKHILLCAGFTCSVLIACQYQPAQQTSFKQTPGTEPGQIRTFPTSSPAKTPQPVESNSGETLPFQTLIKQICNSEPLSANIPTEEEARVNYQPFKSEVFQSRTLKAGEMDFIRLQALPQRPIFSFRSSPGIQIRHLDQSALPILTNPVLSPCTQIQRMRWRPIGVPQSPYLYLIVEAVQSGSYSLTSDPFLVPEDPKLWTETTSVPMYIQGNVYDNQHQPVVGASIVVRSQDEHHVFEAETLTDNSGHYQVKPIPSLVFLDTLVLKTGFPFQSFSKTFYNLLGTDYENQNRFDFGTATKLISPSPIETQSLSEPYSLIQDTLPAYKFQKISEWHTFHHTLEDILNRFPEVKGHLNADTLNFIAGSCGNFLSEKDQEDYFKTLEMVLSNGQDVNLVDAEGKSPVYSATGLIEPNACIKTIYILAGHGANLNLKTKAGFAPLDRIIDSPFNVTLVGYLVDLGAAVNGRIGKPLPYIPMKSRLKTSPYIKINNGQEQLLVTGYYEGQLFDSTLKKVIMGNSKEKIIHLFKNKPDLSDFYNQDLLYTSIFTTFQKPFNTLIQYQDKSYSSLVQFILERANPREKKLLLQDELLLYAVIKELSKVSKKDDIETIVIENITYLLHQGLNIEVKNELNETPLILAAKGKLEKLYQFLLQSGANPKARDYSGLSAEEIHNRN